MKRRRSRQELTAYHEAGHAVAAVSLCRRLGKVTILPDPELKSEGHCVLGPIGKFNADIEWNRRTELKAERDIILFLAGVTAEKIVTGRYPAKMFESSDLRKVTDLAWRVEGDDEKITAYLRGMQERTKALLQSPRAWAAVKALASALLEDEEIRPRTARGLITRAMKRHA
ncbi:MAG: hypothetical protein O7H41_08320 [Planctomycetota bacterium]|nr:hypothetical protein [Planctomycetota bacterium]